MNKTVNHLTVNSICENGVAGHAVPPRQNVWNMHTHKPIPGKWGFSVYKIGKIPIYQ